MTKRTRDYLIQEFKDGERPSGEDFADLMESFLSQEDDGLEIGDDDTLELPRGLRLGNSVNEVPGTLRFNGTTVEFASPSELFASLIPSIFQ